jgi:hypothetical protein
MKDAQRIAKIAESAYIWNLFVESGLFAYATPTREVLEEARVILENDLKRLSENHPDLERKQKALQRLKIINIL